MDILCSNNTKTVWSTSTVQSWVLKAVMPHRVFQHFANQAHNFLHPATIFVYLECWYNPHTLSICSCSTFIYFHLCYKETTKVNKKSSASPVLDTFFYMSKLRTDKPWRKEKVGHLHSESTKGDTCLYWSLEAILKWITEMPAFENLTLKMIAWK